MDKREATMGVEPLRRAVQAFTRLIEPSNVDEAILMRGKEVLAELLQTDDWLPDYFSAPNSTTGRLERQFDTSISNHVYGANIGTVRRYVFDCETGRST
jgi:predicted metal-dependent enzyme (double-stranded beta helix superfamily)